MPRYAAGPCQGRLAGTCKFDTRSIISMVVNGVSTQIETITAYGKFFNYDTATGQQPLGWPPNGSDLTSVARYAAGPCLSRQWKPAPSIPEPISIPS